MTTKRYAPPDAKRPEAAGSATNADHAVTALSATLLLRPVEVALPLRSTSATSAPPSASSSYARHRRSSWASRDAETYWETIVATASSLSLAAVGLSFSPGAGQPA